MWALPRINQCGSGWSDAAVAGARRLGPFRGREEYLVSRAGRSNGSFLINVRVPKDMVRVSAAGTGADLLFTAAGVAEWPRPERPAGDGPAGEARATPGAATRRSWCRSPCCRSNCRRSRRRARRSAPWSAGGAGDRGDRAVVEEFRTTAGHPAIGIRRIRRGAPREDGRRVFSTGQAQVLVVYRAAGALVVVSGACRRPADLNATAALVAGLVARMTVTAAAPVGATTAPARADQIVER